MPDWFQQLVDPIVQNVAPVTAISDPDGLFRDPSLIQAIQAKGFAILQYEDPVAFRFDYESRFRCRWDAGEKIELVVIFKPGEHEFETLPFDVLSKAHRLSFSLKQIFPNLSYEVTSQLESIYYNELFRAHHLYASQPHDRQQTFGFILRHVFGIEPSVIKKVPDLLKMLCQRHYSKAIIPATIDGFLIRCLRQNQNFHDWPLEFIVPSRTAFWEFLNERWPLYVQISKGGTNDLKETANELKYRGPALLPFGHDDVRVYIDNLFEDGLLTPVEWDWNHALNEKWIRVGLLGNKAENLELRLEELLKNLETDCPEITSKPQGWLAFAYRFAQAHFLWSEVPPESRVRLGNRFVFINEKCNKAFNQWLTGNYGGLFNYPPTSPLMVHHIPAFINHYLYQKRGTRAALLLVDGLAIDQWLIIKQSLANNASPIDETSLFAWIPTITPVSRQAAFSGKIPRYFSSTVHRTDCDEQGWRQFWTDRGLTSDQVGFIKASGDHDDLARLGEIISKPATKALGITIYKVDRIMHGMEMGRLGMANQVRTWAEGGFINELLALLQTNGFTVFLTSDHGNTEAVGLGRPNEGVLADKAGERCRIYPDSTLRAKLKMSFPDVLTWENLSLPDNIYTALAPIGKAFVPLNATTVCHGGGTLEEVCVPFIIFPCDP